MATVPFINIAEELETAGLLWQPEIGDEIAPRINKEVVSILVDPQGLTPTELRSAYLWLPSVEQIVFQLEARQAILYHTGLELSEKDLCYKTIVKSSIGVIESCAANLRASLAQALRDVLAGRRVEPMH